MRLLSLSPGLPAAPGLRPRHSVGLALIPQTLPGTCLWNSSQEQMQDLPFVWFLLMLGGLLYSNIATHQIWHFWRKTLSCTFIWSAYWPSKKTYKGDSPAWKLVPSIQWELFQVETSFLPSSQLLKTLNQGSLQKWFNIAIDHERKDKAKKQIHGLSIKSAKH